MTTKRIVKDADGIPVLVEEKVWLAGGGVPDRRPKPVGPGVIAPGTESGNPSHDPSTGKFSGPGNKGKSKSQGSSSAGVIPQDELDRRFDAVRDAAREIEQFEMGDLKDFLAGRTIRDLSDLELQQFLEDVRNQKISDIVDILDQSLKRGVGRSLRARRFVRVQAPRGFVRKTLGGFADDEVRRVALRLMSKGWSDKELNRGLIGRFHESRQGKLAGIIGVD